MLINTLISGGFFSLSTVTVCTSQIIYTFKCVCKLLREKLFCGLCLLVLLICSHSLHCYNNVRKRSVSDFIHLLFLLAFNFVVVFFNFFFRSCSSLTLSCRFLVLTANINHYQKSTLEDGFWTNEK